MIVDDGYTTRENILAAADRGVDLIGGTMQRRCRSGRRGAWRSAASIRPFIPRTSPTIPQTNTYTCPAGKELPYRTTQHDRVGVERQVYQARAADCRDCALRAGRASRGSTGA